MTEQNVLVLIPNNRRDQDLTRVKLDPKTGEMIFDGPVRITDKIAHPLYGGQTVTDYTFALSPDEFANHGKGVYERGRICYFRGEYYIQTEDGPVVFEPIVEIPVIDNDPNVWLGPESAIPIARQMKVKREGLTSLWAFRSVSARDGYYAAMYIVEPPSMKSTSRYQQQNTWRRRDDLDFFDCVRYPIPGVTGPKQVPVDDDGYLHIQFSDKVVSQLRRRLDMGCVIGVRGEKGRPDWY